MPIGPLRGAPPKPIVPPPIPPSKLPQHVAPTPLSRASQIASFAFAAGLTAYAVLLYDFGPREHVFMPVRRWVDAHTASLFTLSEQDRRVLSAQKGGGDLGAEAQAVQPDRRTPIEFFKENPLRAGSAGAAQEEGGQAGAAAAAGAALGAKRAV
ncbi:hypothetical protein Rhopal_007131-T1 [Rhodotorula paludigena]|uniref:Uncharacterized protein n=1 Tax=Rhodotorula paludigena TaxID=86838 RepID=A0AAV5GX50_9BASI|nr:hypothetical protein Rhopal_007131-T1 [Rhodotorula paludigena]